MKIAVIGSGIAGLSAAWKLSGRHRVVLFEAEERLGGHTHTVDIVLEGRSQPVDTGFLVYNERTYPLLIALFEQLGVPVAPSDMSFSVSRGPHQLEWCGASVASLFAQRSNLLSPRFWGMLRDIVRFNRQASALAEVMLHRDRSDNGGYGYVRTAESVESVASAESVESVESVRPTESVRPAESVGTAGSAKSAGPVFGHRSLDTALDVFLRDEGYGEAFASDYLLPMAAAIWSCPMRQMREFPVGTFVRFFHNHGLLQIANRPRWYTVRGGARQYVERMAQQIGDIRLGTPVVSVEARQDAMRPLCLTTRFGEERFDAAVLACHSDQSLRLLRQARPAQREILKAIRYQANRAWLHTDSALMPRARQAWAAWNYLSNRVRVQDRSDDGFAVSVTYWLNRLQPLQVQTPVFVSLNPLREPGPETVLKVIDYAHPVLDLQAVGAQRRLHAIQGVDGIWLAGAWTGYGFHEDGLRSGLAVAQAIEGASSSMALAA
ncbi:MAG: NAD(P)/FAD-dependent oxidoreductase [Betaproteobacteria bacterium]